MKQPPWSEDCEQAVLAAMMFDMGAIETAGDLLKPEDFFRGDHQAIYRISQELHGEGKTVDPMLVHYEMEKRGITAKSELSRLGQYMAELLDQRPAGGIEWHCKAIKRDSLRRAIMTAGIDLQSLAHDGSDDTEQLLEKAVSLIGDLDTRNEQRRGAVSIAELLPEVFAEIEDYQHGRKRGVMTGFTALDDLLCGLLPGQLIVIAARPGVGKTTMAVNIAQHIAIEQTGRVLMFSLEQSKQEITMRVLCSLAEVSSYHIRSGRIDNGQSQKILDTADVLRSAQLLIDDRAGLSPHQLFVAARRIARKQPLKLIVVDYLQIVEPDSAARGETRATQVAGITRRLKTLARDLNVPVVALSQLNRDSAKQNTKPRMSELRESGAIEQDADVVVMLWNKPEDAGTGDICVSVEKQRNGPTGEFKLKHEKKYTRFVDWTDF